MTCYLKPTAVARLRGFPGQIDDGCRGDHVVEDGADASRVRHHDHAEHVKEHHVAVAISGGVSQLLRHEQVLEDGQDVVA